MFQPLGYEASPTSNRASFIISTTFIDKQVLVKVSDGRYFQGQFVCVDHQCNVILQGAHEYQNQNGEGKRWFGMVMIPGNHLIDIRVKAAWTMASLTHNSSMYI